jgi:hypothetical protein
MAESLPTELQELVTRYGHIRGVQRVLDQYARLLKEAPQLIPKFLANIRWEYLGGESQGGHKKAVPNFSIPKDPRLRLTPITQLMREWYGTELERVAELVR